MDHQWILWISLILSIIVVIPMACVRTLRVSFPINFILLAIFTITEGIILGMVSMKYDTDAVIIAAGITTIIVFSLTIFAFQTKVDFTMMGGMLLCVLIFSVYLVYDTQMMIGGDHKYAISPEEYIFAALAIYLDIINIFMYLLRFVGAARSS